MVLAYVVWGWVAEGLSDSGGGAKLCVCAVIMIYHLTGFAKDVAVEFVFNHLIKCGCNWRV